MEQNNTPTPSSRPPRWLRIFWFIVFYLLIFSVLLDFARIYLGASVSGLSITCDVLNLFWIGVYLHTKVIRETVLNFFD